MSSTEFTWLIDSSWSFYSFPAQEVNTTFMIDLVSYSGWSSVSDLQVLATVSSSFFNTTRPYLAPPDIPVELAEWLPGSRTPGKGPPSLSWVPTGRPWCTRRWSRGGCSLGWPPSAWPRWDGEASLATWPLGGPWPLDWLKFHLRSQHRLSLGLW